METFDIIFFAAIAVFLASRLWSVLGQRDDGEHKQRQNPFAVKEVEPDEEDSAPILEPRPKTQALGLMTAGHAPTSLAGAMDEIRKDDPLFDEKKFLEGAKIAFSKIVGSFAAGNMSPIARFLGPAVLESFESAVVHRKTAGQVLENKIEKIVAADIVEARKQGTEAQIAVEFVSHQVNVLRDQKGTIIDGTPGRAEEVRDIWVFRRDLSSSNPNWLLVETRS